MPDMYKVLKEAAIQIGSGGSAGNLYDETNCRLPVLASVFLHRFCRGLHNAPLRFG